MTMLQQRTLANFVLKGDIPSLVSLESLVRLGILKTSFSEGVKVEITQKGWNFLKSTNKSQ